MIKSHAIVYLPERDTIAVGWPDRVMLYDRFQKEWLTLMSPSALDEPHIVVGLAGRLNSIIESAEMIEKCLEIGRGET